MKQLAGHPAVYFLLIVFASPLVAFSSGTPSNTLLPVMQRELKRATAALSKADPSPYFMSYTVADAEVSVIVGENGEIGRAHV